MHRIPEQKIRYAKISMLLQQLQHCNITQIDRNSPAKVAGAMKHLNWAGRRAMSDACRWRENNAAGDVAAAAA